MRSIFTKLMVIAMTLGFSGSALAGFHMEPYAGISISGDYDYTSANQDGDLSRNNFGIKLGYQANMGLQVGGDIQLGTGSLDAVGGDADFANADFGAYVGYQTMMGLRFYAHYMFASAIVIDQVGGDDTFTGSGFKLGAGYSFMNFDIPWLAVNLEYHMMNYDELENLGATTSVDLDANAILLAVSFPFNFGGGK